MLGQRKAATFGVALPARQERLRTRMPRGAWVLAVLAGMELLLTSLVVVKHCAACKKGYLVQSSSDLWCCSCRSSAAHCCHPPSAFVGCLSKASLKTEASWSPCSSRYGSKRSVCLKALDLKRVEVILKSWARQFLSPMDLLKTLKMASCYPPVICIKHFCYVCPFQVLFWSHGCKRKWYSSYSFSFVTEVAS